MLDPLRMAAATFDVSPDFVTDDIGPALRFHQLSGDAGTAPIPCAITWFGDPDSPAVLTPRRERPTPRWRRRSRPHSVARPWQRKPRI